MRQVFEAWLALYQTAGCFQISCHIYLSCFHCIRDETQFTRARLEEMFFQQQEVQRTIFFHSAGGKACFFSGAPEEIHSSGAADG